MKAVVVACPVGSRLGVQARKNASSRVNRLFKFGSVETDSHVA
jgi:hypothetical protein